MLPFARNDYCRYISYEELFGSDGKQVVMNSTMKHRQTQKHDLKTSAFKGKTITQKNKKNKKTKYTYKQKYLETEDDFLQSLNQLKMALHNFGDTGVQQRINNQKNKNKQDKKTLELISQLRKVLAVWKKYNKQIDWNKKNINTDEYMNYKRKLVHLNDQIIQINKNINLLWHKGLLN